MAYNSSYTGAQIDNAISKASQIDTYHQKGRNDTVDFNVKINQYRLSQNGNIQIGTTTKGAKTTVVVKNISSSSISVGFNSSGQPYTVLGSSSVTITPFSYMVAELYCVDDLETGGMVLIKN